MPVVPPGRFAVLLPCAWAFPPPFRGFVIGPNAPAPAASVPGAPPPVDAAAPERASTSSCTAPNSAATNTGPTVVICIRAAATHRVADSRDSAIGTHSHTRLRRPR